VDTARLFLLLHLDSPPLGLNCSYETFNEVPNPYMSFLSITYRFMGTARNR